MKVTIEQNLRNVIDSLNIDDIIPFLEKKIRPKTFTVGGTDDEVHSCLSLNLKQIGI